MLYRLKDDFKRVSHLYHPRTPNSPMLYAILDGQFKGQVWVDNPESPTACLALSSTPYCFIGGNPSHKVLEMMFKILKAKRHYSIIAPTKSFLNINFKANDLICEDRLQFRLLNFQEELLTSWIAKLPSDFTLRAIDEEIFEKCMWKNSITDYYENKEILFENGYGACIVHKERVVSEAYAGFVRENGAEMFSITRESYRGQNLSTIVSSFVIKNIHAKSLQPILSCDTENIAAIKVATKMGFVEDCTYCFFTHK